MATLILDTETTGLSGLPECDIVEAAIVDEHGNTVFHSLCKPNHKIPKDATKIHGITNEMVAQAPSSDIVRQQALELVRGHDLVIYNAQYDCQYFPGIANSARSIQCCMDRFAEWKGEWDSRREQWKWQRLTVAAGIAGCFEPGAHRAVADARMAAGVWRFLERCSHGAGCTI